MTEVKIMEQRFGPRQKTEKELLAFQLEGLKWTLNHVYRNSEFYKKSFDEAKVKPDDIKTLDDIRKLPFTSNKNLQAGYPFPLRSVPFEKITRIHASS
jgi:phenylacetate-CoA ligase